MSNTKRSIIFTTSLFLTILPIIYSLRFFRDSSDLFIVNLLLGFQIICFPLLQMIQRIIITRKHIYDDAVYFKVNLSGLNLKSRFISYLLIGIQLIYFESKYRVLGDISIGGQIANIIIWLVIVEIILTITNKNTYGYFSNYSIAISGIDLKIDFPLNDPLSNDCGVFSYNDFSEFTIKNTKLTLYMYDRRGFYTFKIDKRFQVQIKEFLKAKRIGERK